MNVLVISTVWVEPTSSAAGSRMLQLLTIFKEKGWNVTYASTAGASQNAISLNDFDIETVTIQLNDDSFNAFAKAYNPTIVLFDRFMAEEQFGWRIDEACPNALKILDTEDLHCLRKARAQAVKEERVFEHKDLISDIAKREIASIYRCDLTLMISTVEMDLLQTFFKVPASLLHYVPFLVSTLETDFVPFKERAHFIAIGNFIHPPNWDATLELKKHIWPHIRQQLPQAEMHIYGAYVPEKALQLHNPKEGFLVKGRAESAHQVIRNARVLLAPLRYGAGLKGKFIDAMQCGTPSVTTTIGAEGMSQHLDWLGSVNDDYDAFVKAAVSLYSNESKWQKAQENGVRIINTNFQKDTYASLLTDTLQDLMDNLIMHRAANFTGQMLQHHTMRSTLFMSKWIAEKNKKE